MSDGPHKSMYMRRGWKKLAERADNMAYTSQDVCDLLLETLEQDWREEVSSSLYNQVRDVLSDNQSSLFGDQRVEQLYALRGETAGYPLGCAFLDYAIETAVGGRNGDEALREVIDKTLLDRAMRGALQVEEHYCRKSSRMRASKVTERIKTGIKELNHGRISERLVGADKSKSPRTAKKTAP